MSTLAPTESGSKKLNFSKEQFDQPQTFETLKKMGKTIEMSLAEALPGFMRKQAPAMLRALYTELQKNPKLLQATPASIFGCTIQAGQLGLMLGGALGQAYLVPFWDWKKKINNCTLIVGYKGYLQLVNRSGQVGVINAKTVFDRDTFKRTYGTTPGLIHVPHDYQTVDEVKGRKSVAFYATVQTQYGPAFHCLTRAEAEYHRDQFAMAKDRDKNIFGPWVDHFDAMAMKTCIIKLCKYLPMSAEVQSAIAYDEAAETGEPLDTSFLFSNSIEAGSDTGSDTTSPQQSKTDELRQRLNERSQVDQLPSLMQRLDQAQLWAAFCERHGCTADEVEHSAGATRAAWVDKVNQFFSA